jgi:hypothetical protein
MAPRAHNRATGPEALVREPGNPNSSGHRGQRERPNPHAAAGSPSRDRRAQPQLERAQSHRGPYKRNSSGRAASASRQAQLERQFLPEFGAIEATH